MTFARLVARDLARNPLRLALTVLATTLGVLAFVFLQTVIRLWYAGVAAAQPDRLNVRNKTSLMQPLPISYMQRIESVPGVSTITFGGWFGGRVSDRASDFFASFFVDPTTYPKVYDDLVVPPQELAAWKADPCGALVGKTLADRFHWKTGDRIAMQGDIYPGDWTFTLRGIYTGKTKEVDTTVLAFGYRCLNERLPADRKDQVGFFAVRVDDPARSAQVATAIDGMFANSTTPTKTESERAFQLGFVAMSEAILEAVRIVSYVVLAIMLLVVGNTLALGVRDKSVDLATLRALGFQRRHLLVLVLSESVAMGGAAAIFGIVAAPPVIRVFRAVVSRNLATLPEISVAPTTLVLAAATALGVSLAAGLVPALRASRISVAEGLRRVA